MRLSNQFEDSNVGYDKIDEFIINKQNNDPNLILDLTQIPGFNTNHDEHKEESPLINSENYDIFGNYGNAPNQENNSHIFKVNDWITYIFANAKEYGKVMVVAEDEIGVLLRIEPFVRVEGDANKSVFRRNFEVQHVKDETKLVELEAIIASRVDEHNV